MVAVNAKELAGRAKNGDVGALHVLERIVECHESWKKAVGLQREAGRQAKELVSAAGATVDNAVEQGIPSNPSHEEALGKLRLVEQAYQAQKEALAHAAELKSAATDKVKAAAAELENATQDGLQMTIPGIEG